MSTPARSAGDRCGPVVIVGAGAVGTLLAQCLGPPHASELHRFDLHRAGGAVRADARHLTEDLRLQLHRAGIVILALPLQTIVEVLPNVSAHVGAGTLIVETASIKTPIEMMARQLRSNAGLLGINPLFAPSLGLSGHKLAVVHHRGSDLSAVLLEILQLHGAELVELTARRHDEVCGIVQVATHAAMLAFGGAVKDAGVPVPELLAAATPPFQVMLALLARLVTANPAVYREIQAFNPTAATVRRRLQHGIAALDMHSAESRDECAFATWMAQIAAALEPSLATLKTQAATLIDALYRSDSAPY